MKLKKMLKTIKEIRALIKEYRKINRSKETYNTLPSVGAWPFPRTRDFK